MPTKPEVKTMTKTQAADVLNAVRSEASEGYRAAVPTATPNDLEGLRAIGKVIMGYQPYQNEFLKVLVNRIARVIITSKMYSNPWARFKKGMMEYGETIEEIFVNIAKPHEFDQEAAERNVFKRELPDVLAAFHYMNYTKFYKTTISTQMLQTAFLSYEGISDLVSKIVDSLYTGANYDEFLTMKYMICRAALDGYMRPSTVPELNADNAKTVVAGLKGVSNNLEFLSSAYNYAGVPTSTRKDEQILIVNAAFDAIIDVEVLASAFNMDKAEFMGHRVLVDSFSNIDQARLSLLFENDPNYKPFTEEELTKLATIPAVLVDASWFMIFDNRIDFTEQYNGEGLYWNYWLHTWKTFSFSPFANAIVFTTGENTVAGVALTPAEATVAPGSQLKLSVAVTGTGMVDSGVSWKIEGQESTDTTVTNDGYLVVGKHETATTITVTATSVFNPTVSGSSTITIS